MDAWFVWTIIFLVIALLMYAGSFFVIKEKSVVIRTNQGRYGDETKTNIIPVRSKFRQIILVPLALALITFMVSCWVIVGTNQVGIFTSMGAPYAATDNGFEFKKPWAKKTEFDGSRQFLRFCGKGNNEEDADKKEYPAVNVRIDGNAKADICGNIAWKMRATTPEERKQAISLFREYKVFERVTRNLVYANTKVVMNKVLGTQNPLIPEKNMTVAQINERTLIELRSELNGAVIIEAADISVPDYDPNTDSAIEADLAQKAKTTLAQEKERTNTAEAAANAAIDDSIADPKVLVNKCLDIAKELGYNPGLCMVSGNSGMILDGSALNKKP